jgi:prepilin-type N-terminal cleavage/methylation domain-containing protein
MRISFRSSRRSFRKAGSGGARTLLRPQRGFTLIELMVVLGLVVLITATMLVRQSRFDSSTLLRSLSYSIALSVRQAQVYGTSIIGATTAQGNCAGTYQNGACFAPAYGVYFNGTASYSIFADNNGNGVCDDSVACGGGGADTIVQTFKVGAGFQISKFCGILQSGSRHCSTDGSPISWLTVYFKRPNPDAFFADSAGDTLSGAYVQVTSINDPANTHSITVSQTGEIAVGASGT